MHDQPPRRPGDRLKRLIDVIGASLGLLLLGPVILAVAVANRLLLGRPILYRQPRPGRHGISFDIIKFRTMRDHRDGSGALLPDAQRLTRFGQFIRSTSLDELPELVNVLRGEMSLVGPRPLLREYLDRYSDHQARRHEVRPGLTGWAQVNGRNSTSWEERFELDVWYVDHRSLALDLRIMLRTVSSVVLRRGISASGHETMPPFMGRSTMPGTSTGTDPGAAVRTIVSAEECDEASPGSDGERASALSIAILGLGRYSGAGIISLHLVRALAKEHRVGAIIGREALNIADWAAAARSDGFEIKVLPVYRNLVGALLGFVAPLRVARIARAIRRFEPDAVIVPMTHLWLLPVMRRLPSTHFVVVIHDPEPHPGVLERITNELDRRVAVRAEHVVVHSTTFIDTIASNWNIDRARLSAVPIGPLTTYPVDVAPDRADDDASHDRPTVLCFGRMRSYKGLDVLLQAVPLVAARHPDVVFELVGDGLDDDMARRARATSHVIVDDRWVDDAEIPSIFNRADILVMPYTSATQSGVIPVAAAFGVTVVASDVGGIAEQLDNGRCGVLVPPGDAGALADAIAALLNDVDRRRALGQALGDEYLTRRSWFNIAASFADICKAVSSRTPRS
jgi:lipopolysaccharide/colanic/teichoic acid biosynthesis glycosyltransferase/glycosyltransferase involved in cell wall biosynthesis